MTAYQVTAENSLDCETVEIHAKTAKEAIKYARRRIFVTRYGGKTTWTATKRDDQ